MSDRFKERRPATAAELGALLASFDVISPPDVLQEVEISEVATVDDLGTLRAVLERPEPKSATDDPFLNVAECAELFAHSTAPRDRESFDRALEWTRDPSFSPEVLIETYGGTEWRAVDGIHRAAALYAVRRAEGKTTLHLRVFVLPRPI